MLLSFSTTGSMPVIPHSVLCLCPFFIEEGKVKYRNVPVDNHRFIFSGIFTSIASQFTLSFTVLIILNGFQYLLKTNKIEVTL